MIFKFISIISLSLVLFNGLTKQRNDKINRYALVENKTLTELDLHSLEGHWYWVLNKYDKHINKESCPHSYWHVGEGYVNVTVIQGVISFVQKLEQNKNYLQGKLEMRIEHNKVTSKIPSFVVLIEPVLAIYDVDCDGFDNWYIYSRTENVTKNEIYIGLNKLVEAGAKNDSRGNFGYVYEECVNIIQ